MPHRAFSKQVLHRPRRTALEGFSLLELMIALVVVGVLASIAYPSYQNSVRKSRRAEAVTALSALQQAQERWRGNNAAYTTTLANTAAANTAANGLGISTPTPRGFYAIAVTNANATSYTATATAVAGTSQAADASCAVMSVRADGGMLSFGSGPNATNLDWNDANRCWAR